MNKFYTKQDIIDMQCLTPGNYVEVISYESNSNMPHNEIWKIIEYDRKTDYVEISLLNNKQNYRIPSWRVMPVKYNE